MSPINTKASPPEKKDEPAGEPGQPIPTLVGNREGENVKTEDIY